MGLIQCPECHKEVSTTALACPGCGNPDVPIPCPECGAVIARTLPACPACGCVSPGAFPPATAAVTAPTASPATTVGRRFKSKNALGTLFVLALLALGYNYYYKPENRAIALVKNGFLDHHPEMTIGQGVERQFSNPRWESGKTNRPGVEYVNIIGGISYDQRPVMVTLQFVVNTETGRFQANGVELNRIPQNNPRMLSAVLALLYTN